MRTMFCGVICVLVLAFLFLLSPYAHAADGVTVAPFHLDFSPLIPVINGMIVALAGVLSASVPVLIGLLAKWLWSHGVNLTQQSQKLISDRIGATIQNGIKYAQAGADTEVSKLTVPVKDPAIAIAANYVIAQSPDMLKKAGIDVSTDEGQQTLIRRITAEAQPPAPNQPPTLDVNMKQT